jgi:hypothetical protein
MSRAGRPTTYPGDEPVIEAIRGAQGLIAGAARKLGVPRRTLQGWIAAREHLQAELADQREVLKDRLEAVGFNLAIEEANPTVLMYLLRTVCRDRGYTERQEITGADGGPLEIDVGAALAAALARLG